MVAALLLSTAVLMTQEQTGQPATPSIPVDDRFIARVREQLAVPPRFVIPPPKEPTFRVTVFGRDWNLGRPLVAEAPPVVMGNPFSVANPGAPHTAEAGGGVDLLSMIQAARRARRAKSDAATRKRIQQELVEFCQLHACDPPVVPTPPSPQPSF